MFGYQSLWFINSFTVLNVNTLIDVMKVFINYIKEYILFNNEHPELLGTNDCKCCSLRNKSLLI